MNQLPIQIQYFIIGIHIIYLIIGIIIVFLNDLIKTILNIQNKTRIKYMESYIILILYDINITQLFVFWKTCMNYITIQSSVKYKKRNKNDNLIHCHVYRAGV